MGWKEKKQEEGWRVRCCFSRWAREWCRAPELFVLMPQTLFLTPTVRQRWWRKKAAKFWVELEGVAGPTHWNTSPSLAHWHQAALLPHQRFPRLQSPLIPKASGLMERTWASWQRPGCPGSGALASLSVLFALPMEAMLPPGGVRGPQGVTYKRRLMFIPSLLPTGGSH